MITLLGSSGMIGSDFEGNFLRPTKDECNVLNFNSIYDYLYIHNTDAVINCVGFCGHRDSIEKLKIHELNVQTTRNIALACDKLSIRLVHFTTSIAGEGSTYTVCKRYADEIVKDYCRDYSLVRIPWMFSKNNDKQFLPVIIDHILNNKKLILFNEIGSISYAIDVAEYVVKNIYTLLNEVEVSNEGIVSRLEWSLEVARLLGKDLNYEMSFERKLTKQFSSLHGKLRPWKEALKSCLTEKGLIDV